MVISEALKSMFPWKHQPTEGEKELGSPEKKEQQSSSPCTVQQGEMITCFFQLPCEDTVGVHGAVLLRTRKERKGVRFE